MEAQIAAGQLKILGKVRKRSRVVSYYTGSVALLGLFTVVIALLNSPADWVGLLLFACLAASVELFSVELFQSSRSYVSVSSIIAIASILLFGPLAGALTHMVSGIMTGVTNLRSEGAKSRRASWIRRTAFNAGMLVVAAALAGQVYIRTGGTPGIVNQTSNVLPLAAAVTTDTLTNILILIAVLVLQTGRRPKDIWKRDFQWAAPIAILGGIIGGGVLAMAYSMFGLVGVAAFFLPVLTTSYSFRLYIAKTKTYVDQLETLNRDLQEANLGLMETLSGVIDAYDVYTYGHSAQVAVYAKALAEKLGLPQHEQETIVKAALVHDIGKIGVTDNIIGKQGQLTADEYNLVRRHPIIGAEILSRMNGLRDLAPLVRHHHEWWDGGGYPDGTKGEEIPLAARVLTLADALDALCSDRPYRATMSFREVKEEIARCSGTQFDPRVVEAFFQVLHERGRTFLKNSAVAVDRNILMAGLDLSGVRSRHIKKSELETDDTRLGSDSRDQGHAHGRN
jgi:putative nucleotidyltransferase with HDIG domain